MTARTYTAAEVAAVRAEARREALEEAARWLEEICCGDPGCRVDILDCRARADAESIRALIEEPRDAG